MPSKFATFSHPAEQAPCPPFQLGFLDIPDFIGTSQRYTWGAFAPVPRQPARQVANAMLCTLVVCMVATLGATLPGLPAAKATILYECKSFQQVEVLQLLPKNLVPPEGVSYDSLALTTLPKLQWWDVCFEAPPPAPQPICQSPVPLLTFDVSELFAPRLLPHGITSYNTPVWSMAMCGPDTWAAFPSQEPLATLIDEDGNVNVNCAYYGFTYVQGTGTYKLPSYTAWEVYLNATSGVRERPDIVAIIFDGVAHAAYTAMQETDAVMRHSWKLWRERLDFHVTGWTFFSHARVVHSLLVLAVFGTFQYVVRLYAHTAQRKKTYRRNATYIPLLGLQSLAFACIPDYWVHLAVVQCISWIFFYWRAKRRDLFYFDHQETMPIGSFRQPIGLASYFGMAEVYSNKEEARRYQLDLLNASDLHLTRIIAAATPEQQKAAFMHTRLRGTKRGLCGDCVNATICCFNKKVDKLLSTSLFDRLYYSWHTRAVDVNVTMPLLIAARLEICERVLPRSALEAHAWGGCQAFFEAHVPEGAATFRSGSATYLAIKSKLDPVYVFPLKTNEVDSAEGKEEILDTIVKFAFDVEGDRGCTSNFEGPTKARIMASRQKIYSDADYDFVMGLKRDGLIERIKFKGQDADHSVLNFEDWAEAHGGGTFEDFLLQSVSRDDEDSEETRGWMRAARDSGLDIGNVYDIREAAHARGNVGWLKLADNYVKRCRERDGCEGPITIPIPVNSRLSRLFGESAVEAPCASEEEAHACDDTLQASCCLTDLSGAPHVSSGSQCDPPAPTQEVFGSPTDSTHPPETLLSVPDERPSVEGDFSYSFQPAFKPARRPHYIPADSFFGTRSIGEIDESKSTMMDSQGTITKLSQKGVEELHAHQSAASLVFLDRISKAMTNAQDKRARPLPGENPNLVESAEQPPRTSEKAKRKPKSKAKKSPVEGAVAGSDPVIHYNVAFAKMYEVGHHGYYHSGINSCLTFVTHRHFDGTSTGLLDTRLNRGDVHNIYLFPHTEPVALTLRSWTTFEEDADRIELHFAHSLGKLPSRKVQDPVMNTAVVLKAFNLDNKTWAQVIGVVSHVSDTRVSYTLSTDYGYCRSPVFNGKGAVIAGHILRKFPTTGLPAGPRELKTYTTTSSPSSDPYCQYTASEMFTSSPNAPPVQGDASPAWVPYHEDCTYCDILTVLDGCAQHHDYVRASFTMYNVPHTPHVVPAALFELCDRYQHLLQCNVQTLTPVSFRSWAQPRAMDKLKLKPIGARARLLNEKGLTEFAYITAKGDLEAVKAEVSKFGEPSQFNVPMNVQLEVIQHVVDIERCTAQDYVPADLDRCGACVRNLDLTASAGDKGGLHVRNQQEYFRNLGDGSLEAGFDKLALQLWCLLMVVEQRNDELTPEQLDLAAAGVLDVQVYRANSKNDRYNAKKVETEAFRSIQAPCPLLKALHYYIQQESDNEFCELPDYVCGVDPHAPTDEATVQTIATATQVLCMDVTGYDRLMHPRFLALYFHCYLPAVCRGIPRDLCSLLYSSTCDTIIAFSDGSATQKHQGNPSGYPNTLRLNSVVLRMADLMVAKMIYPEATVQELAAGRRTLICGDDSQIFTIDDKFKDAGNQTVPHTWNQLFSWQTKVEGYEVLTGKTIRQRVACIPPMVARRHHLINGFFFRYTAAPKRTISKLLCATESEDPVKAKARRQGVAEALESLFVLHLRGQCYVPTIDMLLHLTPELERDALIKHVFALHANHMAMVPRHNVGAWGGS